MTHRLAPAALAVILMSAGCSASSTGVGPAPGTDPGQGAAGDLGLSDNAGGPDTSTPTPLDGTTGAPFDAGNPTFGRACNGHEHCAGGWCIETDGGDVCTVECVDTCPHGWACKAVGLFGAADLTSVCVPKVARVCADCTAPVDCGGLPLCALPDRATGDEGGSCLLRCEGLSSPCPGGFVCSARPLLPDLELGWVCAPEGEVGCCAPSREGEIEACEVENEHGRCQGARVCRGGDGWGPCTAPLAATEVCDGEDNDCDGMVDEDLPTQCNCGNGVCDGEAASEDARTCPRDCAVRGDGICSPGESPTEAPEDCCSAEGGGSGCGDGACRGYGCGETPDTCPQDCGTACGDGICTLGENPDACPADCQRFVCGNEVCEPTDGGPTGCPEDCGATCGNCICEGGEDFQGCPGDCGSCGDGVCSPCAALAEEPQTCPRDCGAEAVELCNGKDDDADGRTDEETCDDGDPCTENICDPAAQKCSNPIGNDGSPCDDADACTREDKCAAGFCEGRPGCGPGCGFCPSGLVCTTAGVCKPPGEVEGNTCATAIAIEGLPFTVTASTTLGSNDLSLPAGACGSSHGYGDRGRDHVYSFEPPETGTYLIRLDAEYSPSLYIATGCPNVANTCVGAESGFQGTAELELQLDAGRKLFVIVDGEAYGFGGEEEHGTYTLTVDEPCLSQCAGRECGPDGCGGSCGSCDLNTFCDAAGQCVADSSAKGNTCANPFTADSFPIVFEGTSRHASDNYSYGEDACPGRSWADGTGSHDQVLRFVAPTSGTIVAEVSAGYGGGAYIVEDCRAIDSTCLGAGNSYWEGPGSFQAEVVGGRTYFLIVEAWEDNLDDDGAFKVTLEAPCQPQCSGRECGSDGCVDICGVCTSAEVCDDAGTCVDGETYPGNTCTAPYEVSAIPYHHEGDTSRLGNSYHIGMYGCPGSSNFSDNAPEAVYAFTPASSGAYEVRVSEATFGVAMYLSHECEELDHSCFESTRGYEGQAKLTAHLVAGERTFIFVDGDHDADDGTYSIDITQTCTASCGGKVCGDDGCEGVCGRCTAPQTCGPGGQCVAADPSPGNTCEDAIVVDSLPFAHNGSTATAQALYEQPRLSCSGANDGNGIDAPERVYAFTPTETVRVVVVKEDDFDSALYVVTDCADMRNTCVAAEDSWGDDELGFNASAGKTYYIIIDGRGDYGGKGDYVLRVDPE